LRGNSVIKIQRKNRWFAGFFEDQAGQASRKAVAGYWGLMMLTYMIYKSLNGVQVDMEIFLMVISFTGGIFGLILLERFARQASPAADGK